MYILISLLLYVSDSILFTFPFFVIEFHFGSLQNSTILTFFKLNLKLDTSIERTRIKLLRLLWVDLSIYVFICAELS